MSLPAASYLQFTPDLRITRVLNGMWQVSGAHGTIDPQTAVKEMFAYHDAGFTTWDLADHYGPAEDFIGEFRRRMSAERGEKALGSIQTFTKWVPRSSPITRQIVEDAVATSLRRMRVETLDLLQFHWWDYGNTAYLDALSYLVDLQQQGKIRHLALTNFDTEHLRLVVERGIHIISNQVQYSLIDRRPQMQMAAFCQEHGIQLLAYGALGGGLFSERYLWRNEPGKAALTTASLIKYKQMVDTWGGWALFQELLVTLKHVAERHRVSIANVAVRYVLDCPEVAGVIVGARLGVAEHIADTARIFALQLDPEDYAQIEGVLARSANLYQLIGDCGDEYRR